MRTFRFLALSALLAVAGSACADLDVVNQNDPDRDRAISSPADVEALISGSFTSWWATSHHSYPGAALSVAADAHSSSWGNFGMRDAGWEPRKAYDNDPTYSYNEVTEAPWRLAYRSLAAIRDGFIAIEDGIKIGEGGADTQRALAFGKLVQGMSLANLAVIFDQAFVVDETTDLESVQLVPATEVFAAALAKLDEAIAMGQGASFTIPEVWVGEDGDWTAAYFVEVAKAFRARYRMHMPRTLAERQAVNWQAVLADAQGGISRTFQGVYDGTTPWWGRDKLHTAAYTGWARIDNRTVGPADASGAWETWINAAPDDRRPFDIVTADRRVTGATPNSSGSYYRYMGSSPFPADRGYYHFSNYMDNRWAPLASSSRGAYPDMTAKELEFIVAEANYWIGNRNKGALLAVVNKYRTQNGKLPEFTDAGAVAPGGASCVPQMANGSCGDLWEAFKYEKRVELFHYGMATEYFDDRGWGDLVANTFVHLPVPGSELLLLLQDIYTFGGPEDSTAAPSIIADFSPEAIRLKRQAFERFDKMTLEAPGGVVTR